MTRTKSNSANSELGFTLIELIVVIFILSIASALIIPSFMDAGEGSLKSDAKRMGSALRYVHDESVSKKKDYLFTINLDNDS
ncbi:MAG: prepilin-type N-terminal cleavage/methylation domain-containing protein, partial [Nitrospirota bacterium]